LARLFLFVILNLKFIWNLAFGTWNLPARHQDFTLGKLGKRNVLKNYIKIAIRTILRHKGDSFINVVGIAVGMTCCLLILMWVLGGF
jgi:hypothetical protein